MNSFFGTDGIRARMGTDLFTQARSTDVAHAIASWLISTCITKKPRILIVHDTRQSCSYLKALFKTVFLSRSIDVFDAGVLPTPAAFFFLKQHEYDCALIISASHNAWHDNGIKIINAYGKLSAHDEQQINFFIEHPQHYIINYDQLGTDTVLDGVKNYIRILTGLFKNKFLHAQKIVLDCAYGSTSYVAPEIFSHYGAEVIALNTSPNGFNINDNCGSLHPGYLRQQVLAHQADIGFAFDGDGDRVIAVNRYGVIKNGDDILALLSLHPDYKHQKTIVGTIMSNIALELWVAKQQKLFIRTPVGDKHIAQALIQQDSVLGGEQSGHVILGNYIPSGDGILVALKLLEAMLMLNNPDMTSFTPYPQVLLTVPVKRKCDLSEGPYEQLINQAQQQLPSGRISVRYSGTEKNMLRIMVESEILQEAHAVAQLLAQNLQRELS